MTLELGFENPVAEAQSCFRAVMDALARPGLVKPLGSQLSPPAPLTPEIAGIALSLADPDAPLWLDPALARSSAVRDYLRFHTGARIVDDPRDAAFALVVDLAAMPALSAFAQGTDAYPDRSTTIVIAVEALEGEEKDAALHLSPAGRGRPAGPGEGASTDPDNEEPPHPLTPFTTSPRWGEVKKGALVLKGPGVNDLTRLAVSPLPQDFVSQLEDNRAGFPRGVDLIFVADGRVAALPRSTIVEEAA